MGEHVKREPKMPYAEPVLTDSGTLREPEEGVGAHGTREPKMPYAEPHLTVYGTLRELTRSTQNQGRSDNGRQAGHTRTHIG
jgi:hypothetical protein